MTDPIACQHFMAELQPYRPYRVDRVHWLKQALDRLRAWLFGTRSPESQDEWERHEQG